MVNRPGSVTPVPLLLLLLALLLPGCLRDGFVCEDDGDCFTGETCASGTCRPGPALDACQPETNRELCELQTVCTPSLTVTDSCGAERTVQCDCADACTREDDTQLCVDANAECGSIEAFDSCGTTRRTDCGECVGEEACLQNTCAPCAPPVCPPDAACGEIANACGDVADCGGSCGEGLICFEFQCRPPVLTPDEIREGDRFGERIEYHDDLLAVGAPGHRDENGVEVGRIYVYVLERGVWRLAHTVENPAGLTDPPLGAIFAVRDEFLVGVIGNDIASFVRAPESAYTWVGSVDAMRPIADIELAEDGAMVTGLVDDTTTDTLFYGLCDVATGCSLGSAWNVPGQGSESGALGLGFALDSDGPYLVAGAPFDNRLTTADADAEGSFYLLSNVFLQFLFNTDWTGGYPYFEFFDGDDFNDEPLLRMGTAVAVDSQGYVVVGAPEATPPGLSREVGELFFLSPVGEAPFRVKDRVSGASSEIFSGCGRAVVIATPGIAYASCVGKFSREVEDGLDAAEKATTRGKIYRYEHNFDAQLWNVIGQPIVPGELTHFDRFGWSLEGSDTHLFAGAPGRSLDRGAVYIFPN